LALTFLLVLCILNQEPKDRLCRFLPSWQSFDSAWLVDDERDRLGYLTFQGGMNIQRDGHVLPFGRGARHLRRAVFEREIGHRRQHHHVGGRSQPFNARRRVTLLCETRSRAEPAGGNKNCESERSYSVSHAIPPVAVYEVLRQASFRHLSVFLA